MRIFIYFLKIQLNLILVFTFSLQKWFNQSKIDCILYYYHSINYNAVYLWILFTAINDFCSIAEYSHFNKSIFSISFEYNVPIPSNCFRVGTCFRSLIMPCLKKLTAVTRLDRENGAMKTITRWHDEEKCTLYCYANELNEEIRK